MFARWLVAQFVRQAAHGRLNDVLAKARQAAGGATEAAASQPDTEAADQVCDVLVSFALGIEADGLAKHLEQATTTRCATFTERAGKIGSQRVVIVETGAGREAATQATSDAIQVHQPRHVLVAGFCTGLDDKLRRGHLLMVEQVTNLEDPPLSLGWKLDPQAEQSPGLHFGRLASADAMPREPTERRRLGQQSQALALDHETWSVVTLCRQRGVPCVAVRAVNETVDDQLLPELERLASQPSLAGKLGAATGVLFRRPAAVKEMWKLQENALKTSQRLGRFLLGVLPQLRSEARAGGEEREGEGQGQ